MTDPTPATVQPDPRPETRPVPATDQAYWDAMNDANPVAADGGISWQQLRDGYQRPLIRQAELLPVDVNSDLEQEAPGPVGNDAAV